MKKLLQLLHENRAVARPRALAPLVEQASGSDVATVYLYDMIVSTSVEAEYWGGVAAQDLVPQIKAIKAGTINVRINSPGGDVFAAQAIGATLKQTGAKVIAHVDGYAASAATDIACACNEVHIAQGAMYMIHNAWTFAFGNRHDLAATMALLEKVDANLADKYQLFTKGERAQIVQWMDAETWFTADEALAAGFATQLAETTALESAWNLTAYGQAPKAIYAPPPATKTAPQQQQQSQEQHAHPDHRARQQQRLHTLARTRSP
jgi:ATP-dependent Clp protease protease subunit